MILTWVTHFEVCDWQKLSVIEDRPELQHLVLDGNLPLSSKVFGSGWVWFRSVSSCSLTGPSLICSKKMEEVTIQRLRMESISEAIFYNATHQALVLLKQCVLSSRAVK